MTIENTDTANNVRDIHLPVAQQFVTIACGGNNCGIDITSIREIRSFSPLMVLPGMRYLSARTGTTSQVAVLFTDLDRFKPVNDNFGRHRAGDEVLTEVARRLEALVSPNDIVARVGGDEFVKATIMSSASAVNEYRVLVQNKRQGDSAYCQLHGMFNQWCTARRTQEQGAAIRVSMAACCHQTIAAHLS